MWFAEELSAAELIAALECDDRGTNLEKCTAYMTQRGYTVDVIEFQTVAELPISDSTYFLVGQYDHAFHISVLFVIADGSNARTFLEVNPPRNLRMTSATSLDAVSAGLAIRAVPEVTE